MSRSGLLVALIGWVLWGLGGCGAPDVHESHPELTSGAADAITNAKANDPSLQKFFDTAVGYVVFPSIGKGAIGVGAARGTGVVYEKGVIVGYAAMTQASIGLQLGGQAYTEMLFFETQAAMDAFKSGDFAFGAQATAVAVKAGAGANAKYNAAVAVFTMDESGLMYEASIGGQKFSYSSLK